MKQFYWLLRREFWENKGMLIWLPLAAGAMSSILLNGYLWARIFGKLDERERGWLGLKVGEEITQATLQKIMHWVSHTTFLDSTFIFTGVGVSTFFYAVNTLFDENKDRSAQFWQSLPTSNRAVVLSKLTTAVVIAPSIGIIITIVFAVITAGIHSLVAMKYGPNVFIHLIGNPLFFRQCAELFMMLPFHILWALPTVAWLLAVSAVARSKPALWAGGIPMIVTGLAMLFDKAFETARDPGWALDTILGRSIGSVIPGAWSKFGAPKFEMSLNQNSGDFSLWRVVLHHAFDLSITANLWIGVVLGVAFLCIAIRQRGSRG